MFMCPDCNAKDKTCRRQHGYPSRGKCEICDQVADCVDCKCYHYFPPRDATKAEAEAWYERNNRDRR